MQFITTFVANPFTDGEQAGAWQCVLCGKRLDPCVPDHDGLVASAEGLVAHAERCDQRRCN